MYGIRGVRLTLGRGLLVAFIAFVVAAYWLSVRTNILWRGVTTQGVINNEQVIDCGKNGKKGIFSVQLTDQIGQAQTSTISQCDYDLNASLGDSVTITYLPDDPNTIAPHDQLLEDNLVNLIVAIILGIITLILLPLWIRKQTHKAAG